MIQEAFRRKLCFTVGTSVTTGKQNTTVWAGIHHKTSIHGGSFGFPDATYLDRVKDELKARNITAETVKDKNLNIN